MAEEILNLEEEIDTNLTMRIDDYDDLFNFFDSRDIKFKTISDDYLAEMTRYFQRLMKNSELHRHQFLFLVPQAVRDPLKEQIVISRLEEHFDWFLQKCRKKRKKNVLKAIILLVLSMVFVSSSIYIQNQDVVKGTLSYWLTNSFSTFASMLGWVLFWNTIEIITNRLFSGKDKKELRFYEQINNFDLGFRSRD